MRCYYRLFNSGTQDIVILTKQLQQDFLFEVLHTNWAKTLTTIQSKTYFLSQNEIMFDLINSCPNVIPLRYRNNPAGCTAIYSRCRIYYIVGHLRQCVCIDCVVLSHSDMKPWDVGSIPARLITIFSDKVFPLLQVTNSCI